MDTTQAKAIVEKNYVAPSPVVVAVSAEETAKAEKLANKAEASNVHGSKQEALNILLKFGQDLANKSCQHPVISKKNVVNKYEPTISDVEITRSCSTHKSVTRIINNLKPPVNRPIEADLFSTQYHPPYGLEIGASRSAIFDVLGKPSVFYFDMKKVTYYGADEGGCSHTVDFILSDGAIKEIQWEFCYE
ncbi:MAG TPA: hypothetical protein VIJ25_10635 [Methylococcales bacterium]